MRWRHGILVTVAVLLSYGPWAGAAQAAGLMDWIFPTAAYNPSGNPNVAYYPTTATTGLGWSNLIPNVPIYPPADIYGGAYYPPAAIRRPAFNRGVGGAVAVPGGAAPSGCGTCQPPAVSIPQASTAAPNVVNYAPQLRYRTSWAQVPVTNFRPVTRLDPVTGAQVTAMQPCAATAHQVRRVPTGTSLWCTLFPWCRSCQRRVTVGTCPTVSPVVNGCSSCGSASTTVVPSTTGSSTGIYYPDAVPGTAPGSGTIQVPATGPATQQQIPATRPGTGGAGGTQPGPEPADRRPSLDPTGAAGASRYQQGYAPADSARNGAAATVHSRSAPRADSVDLRRTAPANTVERTPFRLHHQPASPPASPSGNSPAKSQLQPIPDPDVPYSSPDDGNSAPQLLDPRDRTATNPAPGRAGEGVFNASYISPSDAPPILRPTPPAGRPRSNATTGQSSGRLETSGWRKARN